MNNKETMTRLLSSLRDNGNALIRHIIEKHFRVAVSNGYEYEELVGAGTRGLVIGLSAYNKDKSGVGEGNLLTFLYNNVRNGIIDYLRAGYNKKRSNIEDYDEEEISSSLSVVYDDKIENIIDSRSMSEEIKESIASLLDGVETKCVYMLFWEGISERTAAKKLNMTRRLLRIIKANAINKLKEDGRLLKYIR